MTLKLVMAVILLFGALWLFVNQRRIEIFLITYFCVISAKAVVFGADCVKLTKARSTVSATKMYSKDSSFWHYVIHDQRQPDFPWKLTHPHLFHICVVKYCTTISATAELLLKPSTNVPTYTGLTLDLINYLLPCELQPLHVGLHHPLHNHKRLAAISQSEKLSSYTVPLLSAKICQLMFDNKYVKAQPISIIFVRV